MKLIYLASSRIPTEKAHGIQIMKTCEALADRGADVVLLIPRRFNSVKDDPFVYYGVKRNFIIKKLPTLDLIFADKLLGRFPFWLATVTFLLAAKIYLAGKKYDALYSREQRVGRFFKNYHLEIHRLPAKIKSGHKKIWQQAKTLITINNYLKKGLISQGVEADKILVAPDGVDLDKFDIALTKQEARAKLKLPLDKKIVLYTGHLYAWKGADVLAQAARELGQDILTVFVGGLDEDAKKFKEKYGHQENILILGKKQYNQIPFYLKAADVLVLPNSGKEPVSKFCTSPMKLFEYMAGGRPIVASDLPSIREILNEENAVLVTPDDPSALGKSIRLILGEEERAKKIAAQALKDVQKFDWRKRAKIILELIQNYG